MQKCIICTKTDDDPVLYGDFMEHRKIVAHYYCLLLSTHLIQAGKDYSGILGFLKKDILKEVERAMKRLCTFCGMTNASIKCASCRKYFHLVCGVKNKCVFEFYDEFNSYCNEHHLIKHSAQHDSDRGCFICLKRMGQYDPVTSVMASCCSKGWVHINCLRRYALSAGYYLKCLWCSNLTFRDKVRLLGVFVPDRDALWEKQQGAYAGLHMGYSTCDADPCLCPKGNQYRNNRKWKLLICYTCGASGMHASCYKGLIQNAEYMCAECCGILNRTAVSEERTIDEACGTLDRTLYMTKSQLRFQDDPANFSPFKNFKEPTQTTKNVMETTAEDYEQLNPPCTDNKNSANLRKHSSARVNDRPMNSEQEALINGGDIIYKFVNVDFAERSIVGFVEGKLKGNSNRGIFNKTDISITKHISSEERERVDTEIDNLLREIVDESMLKEKTKQIVELSGSESDASADYLLNKLTDK